MDLIRGWQFSISGPFKDYGTLRGLSALAVRGSGLEPTNLKDEDYELSVEVWWPNYARMAPVAVCDCVLQGAWGKHMLRVVSMEYRAYEQTGQERVKAIIRRLA
jgi:hypothetical protein